MNVQRPLVSLVFVTLSTAFVQAQQVVDATLPGPSGSTGFAPHATLTPTGSWSDDFNRPDGTPLGLDWTDQIGTFGISGNRGYCLNTANNWTQHNTASSAYDAATMSIDFHPIVQGQQLKYVALVFGTGAGFDNVFMKVQDNDSDGNYDTVFFYRGINGGSWNPNYAFLLGAQTPSGRMTCYFTNGGDSANLDIDRNFDSVVDDHFEVPGVLAFAANLGTSLGIGTFNSPAFDNWTANDGGPSIVVYCTAGTTSHGCNASIGYSGTPSASASSGFTLSCSNVEGQKSGLFFYGVSGQVALPWGTSGSTSFLCVKAPTQRMPTQNSGGTVNTCTGSFSTDFLSFMAANPAALGQPLVAGETFDVQAWFRDPPAPKTTNLSDALEFDLAP